MILWIKHTLDMAANVAVDGLRGALLNLIRMACRSVSRLRQLDLDQIEARPGKNKVKQPTVVLTTF